MRNRLRITIHHDTLYDYHVVVTGYVVVNHVVAADHLVADHVVIVYR